MKIAVLSESSADESGIRILVDGIRHEQSEITPELPLRSRGWPSVERVLPVVLKHLHYHTDADSLVVVVDSDDSPIHTDLHEKSGADPNCRLCRLRAVIELERSRLRPITNRVPLKCAIGLAVPAIEAWYRCGLDPHVNEATWGRHLGQESITYTRRSLKQAVYGTDRPTIEVATVDPVKAAAYLIQQLDQLETLFPNGFGALLRDLHNW